MSYSVKEIFLSVQGEGAQTGRPSVFVRFSGCNLWSGREQDRATSVCKFCDTDFIGTDGVGGGKFSGAKALADEVLSYWPNGKGTPWVIFTGGEPLLQLDQTLVSAFGKAGIKISVETNGTIAAPGGIDWLCVSPKADAPLLQTSGHELKLVYPQAENHPDDFAGMDFTRFSLQPMEVAGDKEQTRANMQAAFDYCMANPQWHLSLQTHKWIGVR